MNFMVKKILMQKLDEWDLTGNTLLIFMTDNGSAAGSGIYNAGMRGGKGATYEGGSRVPLFMRLSGKIEAGVDIDKLTRHYDIFPTLAELAGAEIPEGLDGRSMLPLINHPNAAWEDRNLFFHIGRWNKKGQKGRWGKGNTDPDKAKYDGFAVRNKKWRVNGNSKGTALFNIANDPGEKKDVKKQHPEIVAEMLKSFDAWWDQVRPLMINEDASLDVPKPFIEQFKKQKAAGGIPDWKETVL